MEETKGQLTVNELIEILKKNFDGDEPVWYCVGDEPECCYIELWEKDVRNGSVWNSDDDIELACQCIIGDLPV